MEAAMSDTKPTKLTTIAPTPERVRVRFAGVIIADTTAALTLRETPYGPVHYIPRQDVRMDLCQRTDHASHCPWKGDASYYSVTIGERVATNAIWTYETPIPAVAAISGYLAFYPDRVDAIEIG
jgi:uncharacterized protein (DUF427 family)